MTDYRRILFMVMVLLIGGVLACNGGAAKPGVEILSPPSGTQVAVGQQVEVEYRASDATAVIRVDLEIEGKVVDSQASPVAEGQPSLSGVLRWTPTEEGTYALLVYAYNRDRTPSDAVGVSIVVGEGTAPESTATIGLILPGATGTPSGISTQPPEAPTATPTRPPAAPTATPTTRPPTATPTRRPPTATPTQRPPTATPTQPPPMANLWLINSSGVRVCEVYFSPPTEPWGNNKLPGGLDDGQSTLFTVSEGNYDLLANDCTGRELSVLWDQPVRGSRDWEIYPLIQVWAGLTVHNQSSVDICEVWLTPEGGVAQNELAGGLIGVGQSRMFDLHEGLWDLEIWDCSNNQLVLEYDLYISGDYGYTVSDYIVMP